MHPMSQNLQKKNERRAGFQGIWNNYLDTLHSKGKMTMLYLITYYIID